MARATQKRALIAQDLVIVQFREQAWILFELLQHALGGRRAHAKAAYAQPIQRAHRVQIANAAGPLIWMRPRN